MDSTTLSVASLLLAVISIILAYVFYRRSRKFKEPTWDSYGRFVIEDSTNGLSKLRVYYGDQEVDNVAIDRIVFWNSGRETLQRSDIVNSDPLRLESLDDGKILDASVVAVNNPPSDVSVEVDEQQKTALIDFNYLDKGQGMVLQVVNTSRKKLKPFGSLKGARQMQKKSVREPDISSKLFPLSLYKRLSPNTRKLSATIFLSLLFILILLVNYYYYFVSPGEFSLTIVVISTLYLIPIIRFTYRSTLSTPPSGLEAYTDPIAGETAA